MQLKWVGRLSGGARVGWCQRSGVLQINEIAQLAAGRNQHSNRVTVQYPDLLITMLSALSDISTGWPQWMAAASEMAHVCTIKRGEQNNEVAVYGYATSLES